MALIELSDVQKRYRLGEVDVHALRGLSLEIEKGEFVALMGASGSGKTTLLNILGCLDHVSSGTYHLNDTVIDARDHDKLAPLRSDTIGFVFQSFNLVPVLSARENVELPMLWNPKARSADERRARALSLLEAVGMKEHAERRPGALSGGQQQRVAVARALANEPRLVLADEPTANLDTQTADQVLDAMTDLWRQEQVTFILATHDPRILTRATRVIYVTDGRVGHGPMHDPETGLFNRPYLEDRLAEELRRTVRTKRPVSVLALATDGEAPSDAADALKRALRASDTCARPRPGLFVALLLDLPEDEGFVIADRVVQEVQSSAGASWAALVSGVEGDDPAALIERAALAAERAQQQGIKVLLEDGADSE